MTHYIDADKLIAEIEKRKYEVFPTNDGKMRACSTPDQLQSGWLNALTWVLRRITSLQQEQSFTSETMEEKDRIDEGFTKFMQKKQEQPEIDLEKEIEEHVIYMPHGEFASDNELLEDMEWARKEFHHFYELGFDAGKKE